MRPVERERGQALQVTGVVLRRGVFAYVILSEAKDLSLRGPSKYATILPADARVVAGSAFDCPGYVRLAYCVSNETIRNSLPAFAKLAAEYGL